MVSSAINYSISWVIQYKIKYEGEEFDPVSNVNVWVDARALRVSNQVELIGHANIMLIIL